MKKSIGNAVIKIIDSIFFMILGFMLGNLALFVHYVKTSDDISESYIQVTVTDVKKVKLIQEYDMEVQDSFGNTKQFHLTKDQQERWNIQTGDEFSIKRNDISFLGMMWYTYSLNGEAVLKSPLVNLE